MRRLTLLYCLSAFLPALLLAACAPTSTPTGTDSSPGSDTATPDLSFVSDPAVTLSGETSAVVQLLHASDQEAGLGAIDDAPRFSVRD